MTSYLELQDNYSNEVYQATACYVIWKNLQNEPARDEKLLRALNENPDTWIVFRHSMMLSLIMALGRIFDTDGDSASIFALVRSCISEIDLFSKENLRGRKARIFSTPEQLESYIQKAYEPTVEDFNRLKPLINEQREIYEEYYKPIRHKIFAHRDKDHLVSTDKLWQATRDANMERMLDFLEDLDSCIRDAYFNGHKPTLKGHKMRENWFAPDIQSLLRRVRDA